MTKKRMVILHFSVPDSVSADALHTDVEQIQDNIRSSIGYGSDYKVFLPNEVSALKSLAWRLISKDIAENI